MTTVFCTGCGSHARPGESFCISCGTPLPPPAVPNSACGLCGSIVEVGDSFCTACGNRTQRPSRDSDPLQQPAVPLDAAQSNRVGVPSSRHASETVALPHVQPQASPRNRRHWSVVALAPIVLAGLLGLGAWVGTRLAGRDSESSGIAPPATEFEARNDRDSRATAAPFPQSSTIAMTEELLAADFGCESTGQALVGTVSGVEDWVAMRAGPELPAAEVDRAPQGAELVYFPTSFTTTSGFGWAEVSHDGSCGWVASKFMKNAEGRIVGPHDGWDYVLRALRDLEPEALHATVTVEDPAAPKEVPFDAATLNDFIAEVQLLEQTLGPIEPVADETFADGSVVGGDGCILGDYMHCRVLLYGPSDGLVGVADVSYVGDGVTAASLDILSAHGTTREAIGLCQSNETPAFVGNTASFRVSLCGEGGSLVYRGAKLSTGASIELTACADPNGGEWIATNRSAPGGPVSYLVNTQTLLVSDGDGAVLVNEDFVEASQFAGVDGPLC